MLQDTSGQKKASCFHEKELMMEPGISLKQSCSFVMKFVMNDMKSCFLMPPGSISLHTVLNLISSRTLLKVLSLSQVSSKSCYEELSTYVLAFLLPALPVPVYPCKLPLSNTDTHLQSNQPTTPSSFVTSLGDPYDHIGLPRVLVC